MPIATDRPKANRKRPTEAVKHAIAGQLAIGLPQTHVAAQLGVSRQTVNKIARSVEEGTKQALGDWRTVQTRKAIAAVDAGLDCTDDSYKRATIGVSVLKGLNIYAADATTALNVILTSAPAGAEDAMRDLIEIEADLIEIDAGEE